MNYKTLCAGLAAFILCAGIGNVPAFAGYRKGGELSVVPKLLEPHENVEAGDRPVVFRWSDSKVSGDTHLHDDIRVFSGNQAYESAMIFKQQVPPNVNRIEVPADKVSRPGIYCWTVRGVGSRSKTRKAFSVFKVAEQA